MLRLAKAVAALLALNAAVFALAFLAPEFAPALYAKLALFFPLNGRFELWQILTYLFVHGGFAHLFFNMFALFTFGAPLEIIWGARRFVVFYLLCGVGAGLVHMGVEYYRFAEAQAALEAAGLSEPALRALLEAGRVPRASLPEAPVRELLATYQGAVVGASGAVYGILVAFGLTFPNAKLFLLFLPFPVAARYFVPALLLLDLFSGVTGFSLFGSGIAHFAHLGGALIGFLLMWRWNGHPFGPPKAPRRRPVFADEHL